ncbi:cytochrome b5 [Halalkalibacillus sediminis]|uniref:Cytochrome b5 n=2 Tax=Halalkalibacillus sediminis TaxID=2018042 RepID=A0A2I0QRN7_9BACI|nr:cytochrome b5 [Halalkalibacillus sediminis]
MTQQILQRLWDTLSSIQLVSEIMVNQVSSPSIPDSMPEPDHAYLGNPAIPPITPTPPLQTHQQTNRDITVEELATFDGKNGRPAYVAVNGTVYDVTNNRAWAAATHFALPAGRDYTSEFATCHAGQQSILATLPVVGRLV